MNTYFVGIVYKDYTTSFTNPLEKTLAVYRRAANPDIAVSVATALFNALCNVYINNQYVENKKIYEISNVSVQLASSYDSQSVGGGDSSANNGETTGTEGTENTDETQQENNGETEQENNGG